MNVDEFRAHFSSGLTRDSSRHSSNHSLDGMDELAPRQGNQVGSSLTDLQGLNGDSRSGGRRGDLGLKDAIGAHPIGHGENKKRGRLVLDQLPQ